MTNMDRATREFFIGGIDLVGQHHNPSDLAFSMQHEIDLHNEGEPNELVTSADVRRAQKFVAKWADVKH